MSKNTEKTTKELAKSIRINLQAEYVRELAKKFNCTPQHVRNALRYISLTESSDAIREGAKEILLREANKI